MKEAVIKLTDKCPCRCSFCESGNGAFYGHKDVPDEYILKLASQLIDEGLQICVLSGGEPLLRAELLNELIAFLHSHGVYVVLNASGVLFSRRDLGSFLNSLPDLIVFSLDSVSPDKHDKHRGIEGLYSCVERTIKSLRDALINEMSIGIRFVMTRHNYHEIGQLIMLCDNWGVDCLKITNIENDAEGHYSLSEQQGVSFFNTVIPEVLESIRACHFEDEGLRTDALQKVVSFMGGMTPSDLHSNLFSKQLSAHAECPLGSQFVLVGGDGKIYPCCESEHHGFPVLGMAGTSEMYAVKERLNSIRYTRMEYCQRCTLLRNIQINFTKKCLVVNDRCER